MAKNPYKTMYRGTSFKKKDGMHRPEGAGNFDNMDDYNIVDSVNTLELYLNGAPINFLHLADTPSSYALKGGYSVKVNPGATGLEFTAPSPILSFKTWNGTSGKAEANSASDVMNVISTDGSITAVASDVAGTDNLDIELDLTNANTWIGEQTFSAVQENTSGKITPIRLINDSDGTTTEDDSFIIMHNLSTTRTLNLHDVSGLGTTRSFTLFILKSGAANTLTIDPAGSDLIDGASTKTITTNLHCIRIQSYNGDWFTVTDNQ
jgi:hypothetical protein